MYIKEQFIKRVEVDNPYSIVDNSTVKIDLLPYCYGNHKHLIIGRYGGGVCRVRSIIVPERVAKGVVSGNTSGSFSSSSDFCGIQKSEFGFI